MTPNATEPKWQTIAILLGRLIFAGVFLMAMSFKFASMESNGWLYCSGRLSISHISSPGSRHF